ncbi:MAG: DUF4148 domain-containing protein [Burkholderiales bacterium]|nr:DUF4148 domain-containing protein [Burkholderiales bacterium]
MFSKTLLIAAASAALLGAGGAFAQEATPAPEIDNFKSTKTRVEVAAETAAAAQAGLIARNEADVQRIAGAGFQPYKSRTQVAAETIEAIRLGLVVHGELPIPEATPAQLASIRLAGERALLGQSLLAQK